MKNDLIWTDLRPFSSIKWQKLTGYEMALRWNDQQKYDLINIIFDYIAINLVFVKRKLLVWLQSNFKNIHSAPLNTMQRAGPPLVCYQQIRKQNGRLSWKNCDATRYRRRKTEQIIPECVRRETFTSEMRQSYRNSP